MDLEEQERAKYSTLWTTFPDYRTVSPGERFASHFFETFGDAIQEGDHIIDFGCGTGRVARTFLEKGLRVTLIDICSPECLDPNIQLLLTLCPDRLTFIQAPLWDLPDTLPPRTWLYCCDVLEHIPPNKVSSVLSQLASRNTKGGYMAICLKDDLFGPKSLNEPLHLSVHPAPWWQERLSSHWTSPRTFPCPDETYLHTALLKK